ncbi:hypothetical protein [Grimontia marina]|uniref:DUF3592 domain-containing protein n=1 Tax=Grimontia marina TaxID=646534 RepID=A0A128FIZ0_9GAMM|nr:hypothetical protein [Grimontia marina]CZF86763.1 hypothetical protein GMA8713_04802 [Grimontia marina]
MSRRKQQRTQSQRDTQSGALNITPEEKKGLIKFGLTIGTIPVAIVAAIFSDNGGQILTAWFAGIVGLAGILMLHKHLIQAQWRYEIVQGEIAGFSSVEQYEKVYEDSIQEQRTVSFSSVFYFRFQGRGYLVEHVISMNGLMLRILGYKAGEPVEMWVPIHKPTLARKNSLFGRYIYLSTGLFFTLISVVLWYFVFTSDFLPG